MRGWFVASAVVAVLYAIDARSAQVQPGGSVPYQTNTHQSYLTTAPVVGHRANATGAEQAPSFGCIPSPMGTHAARNPGSAGPTLSGNNNNCAHGATGTGVIGPH